MSRQGIQTASNKARKTVYKYLEAHEQRYVKYHERYEISRTI